MRHDELVPSLHGKSLWRRSLYGEHTSVLPSKSTVPPGGGSRADAPDADMDAKGSPPAKGVSQNVVAALIWAARSGGGLSVITTSTG
eukprot:scaffold49866_cov27-Tisochrysis_lutea.AAC.2